LLLVSNFSMPRALQPALELASGALVVTMGAYLLFVRWRDLHALHPRRIRIHSEHTHTLSDAGPAADNVLGASKAHAIASGSLATTTSIGHSVLFGRTAVAAGMADSRLGGHDTLGTTTGQDHSHVHSHSHDHVHHHSHVHNHHGHEHTHEHPSGAG